MKERDRIARLQRRLDHLNETLDKPAFPGQIPYLRAEASALKRANWPAGISSSKSAGAS